MGEGDLQRDRRMHVYNVRVRLPEPSVHGNTQSCTSVTRRPVTSPSCPTAALLSSERQLGKCRTSSAELSLHSCWCQLLCPPSPLSPSPTLTTTFSTLNKSAAATCWIQQETQLPSVILQYSVLCLQVSCCFCNMQLLYVSGVPILMAAITIPSCSSRLC